MNHMCSCSCRSTRDVFRGIGLALCKAKLFWYPSSPCCLVKLTLGTPNLDHSSAHDDDDDGTRTHHFPWPASNPCASNFTKQTSICRRHSDTGGAVWKWKRVRTPHFERRWVGAQLSCEGFICSCLWLHFHLQAVCTSIVHASTLIATALILAHRNFLFARKRF